MLEYYLLTGKGTRIWQTEPEKNGNQTEILGKFVDKILGFSYALAFLHLGIFHHSSNNTHW